MKGTNLLFPEEKIIAHREELRLLLRFFGVAATAIFGMGVFLLIPPYLVVISEERELNRALALEEEAGERLHIAEMNRHVREAELALDSLQKFFSSPPNASRLLEKFFSGPGGITMTTITVSKNSAISLGGTAKTRRDLLAFEAYLRESGIIQELSFPLSNLTRETDITFTLQGTLKPIHRL